VIQALICNETVQDILPWLTDRRVAERRRWKLFEMVKPAC